MKTAFGLKKVVVKKLATWVRSNHLKSRKCAQHQMLETTGHTIAFVGSQAVQCFHSYRMSTCRSATAPDQAEGVAWEAKASAADAMFD